MSQLPLPLQIVDYVSGAMKTQAVHACAELGIADLLQAGPQSTAQLAEATSTDQTNLYRLLRLLVAMEILDESAPGVFQATPLSRYLQREESLYHLAMMAGTGWVWQVQEAAEGTGYSLRSGQPALNHLLGWTSGAISKSTRRTPRTFTGRCLPLPVPPTSRSCRH